MLVLFQATHLPAETTRVVLERCYNDLRLLNVPSKTLKAEGFFRSNKVDVLILKLSMYLHGIILQDYCKWEGSLYKIYKG